MKVFHDELNCSSVVFQLKPEYSCFCFFSHLKRRKYGVVTKSLGCPQAQRHQWCRSFLLPRVCHLPAEVRPPCAPPLLPHILFPVCEGGLLAQQTLCALPARDSGRLPRAACSAPARGTESGGCRVEPDRRRILRVVLWRAQRLVAVRWEDQSGAGGRLQQGQEEHRGADCRVPLRSWFGEYGAISPERAWPQAQDKTRHGWHSQEGCCRTEAGFWTSFAGCYPSHGRACHLTWWIGHCKPGTVFVLWGTSIFPPCQTSNNAGASFQQPHRSFSDNPRGFFFSAPHLSDRERGGRGRGRAAGVGMCVLFQWQWGGKRVWRRDCRTNPTKITEGEPASQNASKGWALQCPLQKSWWTVHCDRSLTVMRRKASYSNLEKRVKCSVIHFLPNHMVIWTEKMATYWNVHDVTFCHCPYVSCDAATH